MIDDTELLEWRRIEKIRLSEELTLFAARRQARRFLMPVNEGHVRYKGADCFVFDRTSTKKKMAGHFLPPTPDMLILTRQHIHALEIKHWSGRLEQSGDLWIQKKNTGNDFIGLDLTNGSTDRTQIMLAFLNDQGVAIDPDLVTQHVLFSNRHLTLDASIASIPTVITCNQLKQHLNLQFNVQLQQHLKHQQLGQQLQQNSLSRLKTSHRVFLSGTPTASADAARISQRIAEQTRRANIMKSRISAQQTRCSAHQNIPMSGAINASRMERSHETQLIHAIIDACLKAQDKQESSKKTENHPKNHKVISQQDMEACIEVLRHLHRADPRSGSGSGSGSDTGSARSANAPPETSEEAHEYRSTVSDPLSETTQSTAEMSGSA